MVFLHFCVALPPPPVDPVNLRGIVEFRPRAAGGGGAGRQCRFCLAVVDDAEEQKPGEIVCASPDCKEALEGVCKRTLACGHPCQGVRGEETCPPCLQCGKDAGIIQQDADDECMVCFCGALREQPCIQLRTCVRVFVFVCLCVSACLSACVFVALFN